MEAFVVILSIVGLILVWAIILAIHSLTPWGHRPRHPAAAVAVAVDFNLDLFGEVISEDFK